MDETLKQQSMANELKQFTDLLLNNIASLSGKVDKLQNDMSEVREKVAVLSEKSRSTDDLSDDFESLRSKIVELDKTVAVKSGLWGFVGSIITLLIAIIIAMMSGVFSQSTNSDDFPYRNHNESVTDTISSTN